MEVRQEERGTQMEKIEERRFAIISHISWGAILAGTIIVLVIQLMLAMLGLGIGLQAFNPVENPSAELGIGALIWWIVSAIIALFLGGWVASKLSGIQTRVDGMLHGVVTWGLASLVAFFLFTTTVGTVIGGGMSVFSGAAGNVAPELREQAKKGLEQVLPNQQQQMDPKLRQYYAEQGKEQAEKISSRIGAGALGTFIMLILGATAAAFGGAAGRNKGPSLT